MNENVKKYLDNQLTYFSKGGYDFEVVNMTGEDNALVSTIIVSKDGDRVKWGGGNPYKITNPEIGEDIREVYKNLIYSFNG